MESAAGFVLKPAIISSIKFHLDMWFSFWYFSVCNSYYYIEVSC